MEDKKLGVKSMFYGCCPICKSILVHAQNGMDGYVKCQKCNKFLHIIIRNGTVVAKTKTSYVVR